MLNLFAKLRMGKGYSMNQKEMAEIDKFHLHILDDFGLQPLDTINRTAIIDIVEVRHEKSSIIFISQIPINIWHDILGEQTVADAILDRILHGTHRLELSNESLIKKENKVQNIVIELD